VGFWESFFAATKQYFDQLFNKLGWFYICVFYEFQQIFLREFHPVILKVFEVSTGPMRSQLADAHAAGRDMHRMMHAAIAAPFSWQARGLGRRLCTAWRPSESDESGA